MHCFHDENSDLLIGYFENTLSEAERSAVDTHAAQCEDCRELLALHATLDAYAAPAVSPDFDARLYARIAAEEAKPAWYRWLHVSALAFARSWKLAIPLTAVAAMLAVGVFVFEHRRPVQPADDGTKQALNVNVKVQELDKALDEWELMMPLPADQGNI